MGVTAGKKIIPSLLHSTSATVVYLHFPVKRKENIHRVKLFTFPFLKAQHLFSKLPMSFDIANILAKISQFENIAQFA